MQFAMGLRYKSTVLLYLCILLIRKFHSKDISSTIPEQGSQICNVFLVSGRYGVPDEDLSASSEFDPMHAAKYGRINTTFKDGSHIGAWAARDKPRTEYIQVKLKHLSLIQAIQTQGRNNTGDNPVYIQYVTSYKASYSMDGMNWTFVKDTKESHKLFPGNTDQNTIQTTHLECPLEARYVRIHPWEYKLHPSMRFDLIGCLLIEENSTTDCGFEDGLCGWTQETGNGLLYWTRQNYTQTEEPSIPAEFAEFCADNCSFLALNTHTYSNSNVTFRPNNLMRFIQRSSTPRCLRVWSTVRNISNAYINVTKVGCLRQPAVVRSKIVNVSEHEWTPVAVDVRHRDYQLLLNGGWTIGDQGYLAVGHISLITGICPDCDFEIDLCNWNNTGIINWNLTTEGPRKFISSEVSHNGTDLARLVGPVINGSESRMFQTCLLFSYRIQGAANNTLWVFLDISGLKSLVWERTGSSHGWITEYINLLNGSDFQIEFQGKVESGAVNVDDILVLYKTCPELPTTTANVPTDTTGSNGRKQIHFEKELPTTTANVPTDTTGSNGRKQIHFEKDVPSDDVPMYVGIVAGCLTVIVTLTIIVVYVIRRKKRTTHSKKEVMELDEVKEAKHFEEVEYSVVIKKSGTLTADKLETDLSQIYENQYKPEVYQTDNHSTPEVDQTYDHIPPNEKQPNLNDETYDHATLSTQLYGQNANVPSVLANASLHHMEDGDGENEESYSNVRIGRI